MKLTGIREWFRKCIDNYGFVPPIKYVTPEEYQYAKKFEDRGLKNMTDYPVSKGKREDLLEIVKGDTITIDIDNVSMTEPCNCHERHNTKLGRMSTWHCPVHGEVAVDWNRYYKNKKYCLVDKP